MKYLFIGTFTLLLFSSCIQTRTLTTNNQKLDEFERPDYIGTFASIYYVDANKNVTIDPLQTLKSIYKNDSIIRKRVKRTTFTNQRFDTITSKKINTEIISALNYLKINKKIKGFKTSEIFDEVGQTTKSNFNLYFISTGFIKDTILAQHESDVKFIQSSLGVLSCFAFGVVGIAIYKNTIKTNLQQTYKLEYKEVSYKGAFDGNQGLRGFIIVYDKTKKEICYVREQFFGSKKSPLHLNSIRRQIKHAFKENYY